MIGYVMVGTNDLDRAVAFYDELLSVIGAKKAMSDPGRFVGWSNGGPMLAVTKPHDGNKATFGNGTMVALAVGVHIAISMNISRVSIFSMTTSMQ